MPQFPNLPDALKGKLFSANVGGQDKFFRTDDRGNFTEVSRASIGNGYVNHSLSALDEQVPADVLRWARDTLGADVRVRTSMTPGQAERYNFDEFGRPTMRQTPTTGGASFQAQTAQEVKLGPSVYANIQRDFKVSDKNFNTYFRREGNDIYLKTGAPLTAAQRQAYLPAAPGSPPGGPGGPGSPPGGPGGPGTPPGSAAAPAAAAMAFKESASYKGLSAEDRAFVDTAFDFLRVGGEREAEIFSQAIRSAQAIADPYFKAQLAIAQGEIRQAAAKLTGDYQGQMDALNEAKAALQENLTAGQQALTLEQQAELGNLQRQYDGKLLDIADAAAARGITFGQGRGTRGGFEQAAGAEQGYLVESLTRKANLQREQMDRQARQQQADYGLRGTELERQKQQGISALGLRAEQAIGTAAAGALGLGLPLTATGETPALPGALYEQQQSRLITDISGMIGLQRGLSPSSQ